MSKEVRTFTIKYGINRPLHIAVSLGDIVTIQIGDWYFEGQVKRASDPDNIFNQYQEPKFGTSEK